MFQLTKLRQLIGQRQLLENEQILFNIPDFVKFNNTKLADDMPETLGQKSVNNFHLRFSDLYTGSTSTPVDWFGWT